MQQRMGDEKVKRRQAPVQTGLGLQQRPIFDRIPRCSLRQDSPR